MTGSARIIALRYALIATGVLFIFGLETLVQVWPSGWHWGVGHSHYWNMIAAVYATLGIFLIRASRDPLSNLSLIWFTIWSNLAHALAMTISALGDPVERVGHLTGDVPALLIIAAALTVLTQRASRTEVATFARRATRSAA